MSKHFNRHLLQSGNVKVEQLIGKFKSTILWEQPFATRLELQKLLFQLKGSLVIVIVSFDDKDLVAGSEP